MKDIQAQEIALLDHSQAEQQQMQRQVRPRTAQFVVAVEYVD